jgi:hypothetical protein
MATNVRLDHEAEPAPNDAVTVTPVQFKRSVGETRNAQNAGAASTNRLSEVCIRETLKTKTTGGSCG